MLQDDLRIPPPGYRSAPQRRAAEARRVMLVVGAVGAVLGLGLAGYFVAGGGGSAAVPVIQAAAGPVKVKPADPGGLAVNTQTNALLGGNGASGDANLAPAPEVPDPAALAAAAQQEQATQSKAVVTAVPRAVVAVPAVPENPAASAPQETALNVLPPSRTSGQVHNLAEEYKPPVPSDAGRSHVSVQLAALDSHEAALREWDHLTHRMPSLFDGRHPIFAEAHVNGHTYWRVRTAGFTTIADAKRFCGDVHAQGRACTVASF
jgi:hypothetical protein